MKRRLRVNGHTEWAVGARPRVFPLHFPGCKPGHVHVSFTGRGTGENTTTYDRLEGCPRRVVVQDAELFRDGHLIQEDRSEFSGEIRASHPRRRSRGRGR